MWLSGKESGEGRPPAKEITSGCCVSLRISRMTFPVIPSIRRAKDSSLWLTANDHLGFGNWANHTFRDRRPLPSSAKSKSRPPGTGSRRLAGRRLDCDDSYSWRILTGPFTRTWHESRKPF